MAKGRVAGGRQCFTQPPKRAVVILTMEELKHFRKSTLKGEKRNGHHLEKEALQFGTRYRTMWYSVEEGKAGGLGEEGSGRRCGLSCA